MEYINKLKEVMKLKPVKMLLSAPTKDTSVWVSVTDKFLVIKSKSRYRDVGTTYYNHDLQTGEFVNTFGSYYNTKFERITIAVYNELKQIYII